jgi:hypothetical protein
MKTDLRRRVELLHLHRLDAAPMPPAHVVWRPLPGESCGPKDLLPGETNDEGRARLGIPADALLIVINVIDASVPRD